ncbi:MAG: L-lactate dehydrogenase, partial [Xanthomonadales bacterium]|nr:L-lactate dehydrogenase [Xanthomonadales bacterium]
MEKKTVGIVGTGNVGVAAAFAIFLGRIASRIRLVDKDAERAEGEAMDLMHGQALVGPTVVRAGG